MNVKEIWLLILAYILAIIVTYFVTGCAGLKPNEMHRPVCRHNSVMAAMVFGEKYPVRIAVGPAINRDGSFIEGKYHAQAIALIDNEWEWLEVNSGYVVVSERDWWFKIEKFVTIEEAMKWSKQVQFIGEIK